MATTSWKSAGSGISYLYPGIEEQSWVDPDRVTADDTSYATIPVIDPTIFSLHSESEALYAFNFGFTSSDFGGSTTFITQGIEFRVQRKTGTANFFKDEAIHVMRAGIPSTTSIPNGSYWSTSDETITYGGASELWGETWTYSHLASSSFGVYVKPPLRGETEGISDTAYIDYIDLRIHYSLVSPSTFFHLLT